jgi:hypothetical protein
MTSCVVGTRKTERMVSGARVRERTGESPYNAHLGRMEFFRALWDPVWSRLADVPVWSFVPLADVGCAVAVRRLRGATWQSKCKSGTDVIKERVRQLVARLFRFPSTGFT